jgi:hypothetical protein
LATICQILTFLLQIGTLRRSLPLSRSEKNSHLP